MINSVRVVVISAAIFTASVGSARDLFRYLPPNIDKTSLAVSPNSDVPKTRGSIRVVFKGFLSSGGKLKIVLSSDGNERIVEPKQQVVLNGVSYEIRKLGDGVSIELVSSKTLQEPIRLALGEVMYVSN